MCVALSSLSYLAGLVRHMIYFFFFCQLSWRITYLCALFASDDVEGEFDMNPGNSVRV